MKSAGFECLVSDEYVDYISAIDMMQQRIHDIQEKNAPGLLWFLEHHPVYTAGSSAEEADLLAVDDAIPVLQTNRGGKHTYHGPGQLVVYTVFNIKESGIDIRTYVKLLEQWIMDVLSLYGIATFIVPERVGVWMKNPWTSCEEKIAAIGLRITRGIVWHGFALNVCPHLEDFRGIVPCGLKEYGVTSLQENSVFVDVKTIICDFKATMPDLFKNNANELKKN